MPRRQRVDSAAAAVAIVRASARPLSPPAGIALRKCDAPHWDAVLAGKPRSWWTDERLTVAAQLARCIADIERVASLDDGTNAANIESTLVATDKLCTREKGLRLMLDLKPAAEGDKGERQRREELTVAIEKGAARGGASSLLN